MMQINQSNKYSHSTTITGNVPASSGVTIAAPVPHAHLISVAYNSGINVRVYTSDAPINVSTENAGINGVPPDIAIDIVCDYCYLDNTTSSTLSYSLVFQW